MPTQGRIKFSTNWFDNKKRRAIANGLRGLSGGKELRFLEVGVFEGRSFLWFFKSFCRSPRARAIAIERNPRMARIFRENLRQSGHRSQVRVFVRSCHEVIPKLKMASFDLIHIDGGHDLKNVLRDAVYAWGVLKVGGYIVFDDYGMGQADFPWTQRPQHALDFFLTAFRDELEIIHRNYLLILRKVPPRSRGREGSLVGPYSLDWYSKTLFFESVGFSLSKQELKILYRIFDGIRPGQTKPILPSQLRQSKSFRRLANRWRLRLDSFY